MANKSRHDIELEREAYERMRQGTLQRKRELERNPPPCKPVARPFQGVGQTMTRAYEDESEGE